MCWYQYVLCVSHHIPGQVCLIVSNYTFCVIDVSAPCKYTHATITHQGDKQLMDMALYKGRIKL